MHKADTLETNHLIHFRQVIASDRIKTWIWPVNLYLGENIPARLGVEDDLK